MSDESRLLDLFGRLGDEQQDRLIAFAEFLAASAVIDNLEAVFARHYQREKEKGKREKEA